MFPSPGANGSLVADVRPAAAAAKSTGGGMAGWFSSLRRQPKAKKTSVAKALQKSCVDLSTAATGPVVLSKAGSSQSATSGQHSVSDNKKESVLKQTSSVWTFNNAPSSVTSSSSSANPSSVGPALISHTETIQLDRHRRITPAVTTTHTKIVQTTVTTKQSHRVGLVFNDDGELISKVDDAFRNFANSLNTQLGDGNAALLGRLALITSGQQHNNNNSDSDSCRSSSLGGSSNQLDSGEIEFIDCDRSPSASVTPPHLAQTAPPSKAVKCDVKVAKVHNSCGRRCRACASMNNPLKSSQT